MSFQPPPGFGPPGSRTIPLHRISGVFNRPLDMEAQLPVSLPPEDPALACKPTPWPLPRW
jgi:hypothetical protein